MSEERLNIVLVGMPGAGKSTVGVILAKWMAKTFLDTDILIQTQTGRTLQDIVDRDGHLYLRQIEEDVLLQLDQRNSVIATGGSAVYSQAAMKHLKRDGVVVFLRTNLDTLRKRVRDFGTRGLAKRPDQTFGELFEERRVLYEQYADITVEGDRPTPEDTSDEIRRRLASLGLVRAGGSTGLSGPA